MIRRTRHTIELDGPFWRYGDLFGDQPAQLLLDSALPGDRLGRWSFLVGPPSALLTGRRRPGSREMDLTLTTWRDPSGVPPADHPVRCWAENPFAALRDLKTAYDPGPVNGGSPFQGGLAGYFGYEAGHAIESYPDTGDNDLDSPDLAFMVVDEVLVHDHREESTTLHLISRGLADESARLADWRARLAAYAQSLGPLPDFEPVPLPQADRSDLSADVRGSFDLVSYSEVVARCRRHILDGNVFEVCPTQRLEMDLNGDPWALYGALRTVTPSPFAAWLRLPGLTVACASPERFLSLDAHRVAESRPIKGTRPRGNDEAADHAWRTDLETSDKDRAENVMIVDLVRNDLGKVAKTGSVSVPELQVVEAYATVFQMVSTVRAELRDDCDALDLVRACFPGGSMTGAPKIAAMTIIDALEPVKRGVYSGAIGYLDYSGTMDLNIVIRTLVCNHGRATFGVGGAVVSDSDPAAEYRETLDKARALIAAVRLANS
jgi:para-aminobenzoate synthetase component 1